MINFRFHLVSIIAVFLALALGVVMGSTLIDRAIVDGLRNRINRVEHNVEVRKAENDTLRAEVSRLRDYVDKTKEFSVNGQLPDVPVTVVAIRGVDGAAVDNTVALAQRAGARAPGVLWIEDKLALSDDNSTKQLGQIIGRPGLSASATRDAAWAALALRLATGSSSSGADLLRALGDAGFVKFEKVGNQAGDSFSLDSYPGLTARTLLVDGTDGRLASKQLVVPLSRALTASRVPLVVAEVYRHRDGGPDRGAVATIPVQVDDGLKVSVSTVNDLELTQGQVAAVLALADLGRNRVGNYGYGTGAKTVLPPWSTP